MLIILAASFAVPCASQAAGETSQPSSQTSTSNAPSDADAQAIKKILYFSGFDIWRHGGSFHGGMMWAPRGIDNEGFTLKILLAQGTYRYLSGLTLTRGTYMLASIMPGWKLKSGAWDVTFMAGPDFQIHAFSPDDLTNNLRGQHVGFRGGMDVWWQRSPTTMMQASISASSLGATYSGRIAGGWRMFDKFWMGPEFIINGDHTYQQYRLGAHVTSLVIGTIESTFAMGYARDSDSRSGPYGRFGFIMKR